MTGAELRKDMVAAAETPPDAASRFPTKTPRTVAASGSRTVPAWWRATVQAHGARDAVREHGRSVTFRELDERSARLARGLMAAGLGKGARIAMLFPNGSDWIAAWLAISRMGGIAVCMSTFFSPKEMAYALRHADTAALLTAGSYLRHDYGTRLEEALPGLAARPGDAPLTLLEAPYLRTIWIGDEAPPPWAAGTMRDLEARGSGSDAFGEALLASVEGTVSPADQSMMIFTSGTTADPKAVVHTQGALIDKIVYLSEVDTIIPCETDTGDRPLITSPFFWVGGLLSMAGSLTVGATVICEDDHSGAALLARMRSEGVTHLSGWGAVARGLEESGAAAGELDRLKPQAAPQMAFSSRARGIPPARFSNSLGMTETMGPHSGLPFGGLLPPGKDGAFGHVLPAMEFRIVDPESRAPLPPGAPGELTVRGRWLMEGFYKRERHEVFDADGFYGTGDRCTLDADGYLFFHGRLGGMIKTSGANVSPEEVEIAMRAHPDVLEAAVFGLPHPKLGELVVGVAAKSGDSDLTEDELKQFLKTQLSSFKVPKRIVFMAREDLPMTASEKIRRSALAEMLSETLRA